ncbi:MAG: lysophospholipid acyltransferase family protein [Candidatus Anammoximicrobium sp.]|nr:lysophospholipid acyltransferase family protein [Candidatus Anammoximicrobium sp.]
MKQLTDWLVYLVVRLAICCVQALSLESCHAIARTLAWVACDLIRLRRRVVEENLRQVFPELSDGDRRVLARRMWEHLLLMGCEIAHAPRKIHETNWRRYFRFNGKREMVAYLLDPRPTVFVSGHFGNFELSSYMMGLFGFPTYAIARPLDNPYLDRYVNQFRSTHGQFILPKDGSAAQVDAVLRSGGVIALLADQHAGRKGCWIDFFGRPASCHKAVALFTLVSGAPLVVAYGRRVGGPLQFELGTGGVADPRSHSPDLAGVKPLTQWYNRVLEEIILTAPEQYWWVHRRWKDPAAKKEKPQEPAKPAALADDRPARSAA